MHQTTTMEHNNEMTETIYNIHNRKTQNSISINENTVDTVVFQVIQEFQQRAAFGYNKYGTDLDRDDLTLVEWIQHAKEEHMDAILYLEKIRQVEMKRNELTKKQLDEISRQNDGITCLLIAIALSWLIILVKTEIIRLFSEL
jgi:hypothetical protein